MLYLNICSLFLLIFTSYTFADDTPAWRWECVKNRCEKQLITKETQASALSLAACQLFCTDNAALWPKPTGKLSIGNSLLHLNHNSIDILSKKSDSPAGLLIAEAGKRFKAIIGATNDNIVKKSGGRSLEVHVELADFNKIDLTLETDESYTLLVNEKTDGRLNATIIAQNFFGARNGLETLAQLVIYDDIRNELQIATEVLVTDKPVYTYRGILLDTARNYITIDSILRTIDAMASSKLNTFHWHITDSQSFPFVSKSFPNLTKYGAYTPSKVYTAEDIKKVIEYGRVRGVRVMPEFDAPAHVGEGWQGTDLVACFNAQPWNKYCVEPPCGQLDPTQPKLYDVLEGIYGDMIELFNPDIFHMGGDEVSVNCWNSTENIVNWMKKKGWGLTEADFMKLWDVFQTQALERLFKKTGKEIPVIMWTSTLTHVDYVEKYLPKEKYIIQIWTTGTDAQIKNLLDRDYRLILSNYDALYLDCGFEGWVQSGNNWCSPYIGWQKVYNNSPLKMFGKEKQRNFMGAEAALWTEQVDDSAVDSRLWPRSAAMAERLWAEPEETWEGAEKRMLIHRQRLVDNGIKAAAMQPEWCLQYQDNCPVNNPVA